MAGITHFKNVSGVDAIYTGKAGSEVKVAGGGYLYQNGVQVTKSAEQINQSLAAVAGSTGATGTAIPNSGITTIGSTAKAVKYVIANPTAAGDRKMIICTAGSTTNTSTVTTGSTNCTFDGSNKTLTFNAAGDSVDLVALSTTRWFINVNNGSVALS
jgi:hypothetical protein